MLFISTDGHKPPDHRGAVGPVLVCRLYDHEEMLGIVGTIKDAPPATDLVEGEDYLLVCTVDGEVVRIAVVAYDPNRFVVDPATLAQTAARSLPLLYPVPSTAPPSDQTQLVGVATWLWIDAQDFTDVSASISIANLRVTATAHPARVLWDLGDGTETVVCDGPGTPYRADVADADQHTDCRRVHPGGRVQGHQCRSSGT